MLIESLTRDERLKERRDSEGGEEWKNVERETLERSEKLRGKKFVQFSWKVINRM